MRIKESVKFLVHVFRNHFKYKIILFYPEKPHEKYAIFQVCWKNGWFMTDDLSKKADLSFYWQDATYGERLSELENSQVKKILNIDCLDISKSKVDEIFEKVFGYSAKVSPLTFQDKIVVKSEVNAKHDGFIAQGPLKVADKDHIYQKLINNQIREGIYQDIRVTILLGELVLVTIKERDDKTRFDTEYLTAYFKELDEVLKPEEVRKIITFCESIGLDYGDLDILRDVNDKRIYIVDVNKTAYGPAHGLSESDQKIAIDMLATAFLKIV